MSAAGVSLAARSVVGGERPAKPLRVIAYNIYGATGWPQDRTLARRAVEKGQMATRLAMELALHDPDIVNFSESPGEKVTLEVAKYLGMNHVRFPSGGSWPGTLLSRYEISESKNVPLGHERPKELFTRHWGRGTIRRICTRRPIRESGCRKSKPCWQACRPTSGQGGPCC